MSKFPTVKKFKLVGNEYVPFITGDDGKLIQVAWAAQPGSQAAFLSFSTTEVLYEGTRGPGKTDALLMDFYQHVGQGYGAEWRGILFRQTHPQLSDVIEKSKKWFRRFCPGALYNEMKYQWEFPTGERLYFRHFEVPSQYSNYHGHNYPWIGWEELTTWPDDKCFKSMFSCLRSTAPGIPLKVRATTNPYGVGHNWVKLRYRLPVPPGHIIGPLIEGSLDSEGHSEPPRRAVHGHLDENKLLLHTDPEYKNRIIAAARNESERRAWLDGDWDIVAGGMFDDIWYEYKSIVVVPPFEVPPTWTITRAFDYGSSKPFSVGWFAESDGTDLTFPDSSVRATVRGDLFLIQEWYGWRGQRNEGSRMLVEDIAKGIVKREVEWGWRAEDGKRNRVKRGPADTGIFDDNNGVCIANDFAKPIVYNGVHHRGILWEPADKGPHSREQGWEQLRRWLKATKRPPNGYREIPGLFICSNCEQWLQTVPVLPRDEVKIDDVDTEAEDHCFAAGTLVDLPSGQVPIEQLPQSGDVHSVSRIESYQDARLTRKAAQVVRLTFSGGQSIVCTPDEKYLVDLDEWCYAKDLLGKEVLCSQSLSATRSKSSTEFDTIFAGNISSEKAFAFISKCGSTITDLCRMGIISIIGLLGTGTRALSLNALPLKSILEFTTTEKSLVSAVGNISVARESLPPHGMRQSKDANGTPIITKSMFGRLLRSASGYIAKSAENISRRLICAETMQSSVAGDARRVTCVGVENLLDRRDVYCLTVPTNHTFSVEGGILVRNCGDMTRYRLRYESRGVISRHI
jgi:hypothetical protein